MDRSAITVKDLEYTYPGMTEPSLNQVNLTVKSGEFVTIIGQTGSGKSTLVSIMDGLALPTKGELIVNKLRINADTKPATLSKLHHQVGFVFQFPEQQLFAETVAADIAFGPQNLGWSKERVAIAVDKALKLVGLPNELKQQSPFALSGGQMRRVAIAGVLAMEPAILILDEPTAGLDTAAANSLLKIVNNLRANGTTIIMITHQMQQVADYADHVLVMNHGRLIMDTTPRSLFANPAQLEQLSLALPTSIQVARDLANQEIKLKNAIPLTMAELADSIADALGRKEYE